MTDLLTTTTPNTIMIERAYDASPERVFRAWADPEQMRRWFIPAEGATVTALTADVRVGGQYRMEMTGPTGVGAGEYLRVEPPSVLEFTWLWEGSRHEPNVTVVRVDFTPISAGTRVTITHSNLSSEGSAHGHTHGWTSVLAHLAAFLD